MPVIVSKAGVRRRGSDFVGTVPIAIFFDWHQAGQFMKAMFKEGEQVFSSTPLPSEAFL